MTFEAWDPPTDSERLSAWLAPSTCPDPAAQSTRIESVRVATVEQHPSGRGLLECFDAARALGTGYGTPVESEVSGTGPQHFLYLRCQRHQQASLRPGG